MKTVQERLKEYGKQCQPALDEDRVKEAVWRGQAAFFEEAEKCQASYFDFFWQQAGYIRKRWWGLQLLAFPKKEGSRAQWESWRQCLRFC